MAYWNRKTRAERPEWPKLVRIGGTMAEAPAIAAILQAADPEVRIVDGGRHGIFAQCHSAASVSAAQDFAGSPEDPAKSAPDIE